MKNSSYLIYSIIQNLHVVYTKKGYTDGVCIDDFIQKVHISRFKRVKSPYQLRMYGRLYNAVENSYIDHKDIIIGYLHESLFSSTKVNVMGLTIDRIKEIRGLYTEKKLNVDKILIKDIITELDISKLVDIFNVNNDGESIIYSLIKKEHISPIFYLQYAKKLLTDRQENNILRSDNFKHFENISNIIFNILTEG